jgi:hypothetical protein
MTKQFETQGSHRTGVEIVEDVVSQAGVDSAATLPGVRGKLQLVSAQLISDGDDGEKLWIGIGSRRMFGAVSG